MDNITYFIDAIQSIGIDSGVARIQMMQIKPDGKGHTELILMIPVTSIKGVIEGLQKISR